MEENNIFDIVNFIEKNPLSRLSKDYESQLINKIKSSFTTSQQQFFLTNFYTYLNYDNSNDFVINLDDIWKWIGFSRKDPAKRLLDKYFVKDIDYKISLHQSVEQNHRGGQNKEQILLNINSFKKFCLKSDTKKADEIHDYYVKLERLLQETILEETDELRKELQIKTNELIEKDNKHKNELKISKDNTLINSHKGKRCVYIGEIEENKFIKIGSTKETYERKKSHIKKYGNFIFLEIFQCDNFREVEENILNDPIIKKNLYREPINNHVSQEVVLLSDNFNYEQLISIVKKYVSQVYFLTPEQILEKQKYEIEERKLIIEEKKIELEKMKIIYNIENNNQEICKIYNYNIDNKNIDNKNIDNKNIDDNNENIDNNNKNIDNKNIDNENIKIINNKEIKQKISNEETEKEINKQFNKQLKLTENNNIVKSKLESKENSKILNKKPLGRKIQKIDPCNLNNIIQVYDSMIYLLRAPENEGCNKSNIQDAISFNRIYKGYRWNFVENGDDPNISKAEPTKLTKNPPIINTIIKLNESKSEIIETYPTKKDLIKELGITKNKLRHIINNNEIYNNHYYIEYSDCPSYLLNNYNKPINKNSSTISKSIKRINPITNEITIFESFNDIYIKQGISSVSIRKAIDNKKEYSNYLWEYA